VTVAASYYDGSSSARHLVQVDCPQPGWIRITGQGIQTQWPLSKVRIPSRIGDAARVLYFPDGSQCETRDHDGVERLLASQQKPSGWSLHRLERSLAYAGAALALTATCIWAIVVYGIPTLAKEVAFRLPPSTEKSIATDGLRALDQALLRPSTLPPDRQAALRALFADVTSDHPDKAGYRLEFRAGGPIGANALALPGSLVVLTDELVKLAQNDAEISAVLAHEAGHLRQRHALRSLLQNSAAALFVAVAIGDLTSITSLAAGLPTLLLQLKYSREFENEADESALAYLQARGIPAGHFAALITRLGAAHGAGASGIHYLSTHPAAAERAARALEKRSSRGVR